MLSIIQYFQELYESSLLHLVSIIPSISNEDNMLILFNRLYIQSQYLCIHIDLNHCAQVRFVNNLGRQFHIWFLENSFMVPTSTIVCNGIWVMYANPKENLFQGPRFILFYRIIRNYIFCVYWILWSITLQYFLIVARR